MDAQIQYFEAMGQFWLVDADFAKFSHARVADEVKVVSDDPDNRIVHHTITTPDGTLTYKTGGDRKTTWITEYLIKRDEDIDLIRKYMPVPALDPKPIGRNVRRIGDARHPPRLRLGRPGRLLAARLLPDGRRGADPRCHRPARLGARAAATSCWTRSCGSSRSMNGAKFDLDRDRRRGRQRHGDLADHAPRSSACPTTARCTTPCTTWASRSPTTPAAA